ncbi:iron uptake porin [Chamaesiphon minutus]|uniref:Carbohydrate-selective porin, OprB family n=1 Tax=Chamaesiphon minutus (strain ATCC 27169 / PCC 6605) TaxID=1173020 RepID=K9UAM3_CHAP6|nr:iron uptake porin [Chamaesiphon minutus]AFY91880.1 Carbohydrate-selective porin, OprB family [Chamaesiphon minutus PCC 6605]
MFNLNVIKSLILTASIFVVMGVLGSEARGAEKLADRELVPMPKVLSSDMPLRDRITDPTPATILPPSSTTIGQSIPSSEDVKPPDWAVTALETLSDRYDCQTEDPDRNRASLTRAEFVTSLNICLSQVNESLAVAASDRKIAAEPSDPVTKADLETIEKLQAEFATELTALRGQVEAIEAKTARIEKQQFSATTKLSGTVWVNFTGALTGGDITTERSLAQGGNSPFIAPTRVNGVPTRVQRRDANPTVSNYVFLTLNSSFTGKDMLVTQLVAGNANSPANQLVSSGFFNTWGTPLADQTGTPQAGSNAVYLRELSYTFPVNDQVRVAVGPRLNAYRYFDQNRFTSFLTGSGSFNSSGSTLFAAIDRGSGAVVSWNINPQLRFNVGYLGENTEFLSSAAGFNTSSNPAAGLFGSTNQTIGELTYSPNKDVNLRLLYSRSLIRAYNGFIGGAVGEPLPYGYADDGFGGRLNDAPADTVVANFDWLLTPQVGIFGRYSYGKTQINPVNTARAGGSTSVQSIQIGLGFPDLGKKGALGVISYLIPHSYLSGREFLLSGGGDGGKQQELEISYYYPATPNLAIVPAVYAIFSPNNFQSNPPVFIGNLRMQFTF